MIEQEIIGWVSEILRNYDLHLQERAVLAAEAQAQNAELLIYMGLAQIFAIALTVVFAAVSSWAAISAAKSAEKATERDRAWVCFESAEQCYLPMDGTGLSDIREFHYTVLWKNFGNTPAINFRSFTGYRIVQRGELPQPISDDELEQNKVQSENMKAILPPGSPLSATSIHLSHEQMNNAADGTIDIYVVALCIYEDIYNSGTERQTHYSARLLVSRDADLVAPSQRRVLAMNAGRNIAN